MFPNTILLILSPKTEQVVKWGSSDVSVGQNRGGEGETGQERRRERSKVQQQLLLLYSKEQREQSQ